MTAPGTLKIIRLKLNPRKAARKKKKRKRRKGFVLAFYAHPSGEPVFLGASGRFVRRKANAHVFPSKAAARRSIQPIFKATGARFHSALVLPA